MEAAIRENVPPKTIDLNLKAFRKGLEIGGKAPIEEPVTPCDCMSTRRRAFSDRRACPSPPSRVARTADEAVAALKPRSSSPS